MNRYRAVMVCLFLLCTFRGFTQLYQPATWYTTSGGLDTGLVRFRNIHLNKADDYAYGEKGKRYLFKQTFIPSEHTDLEWLAVAGDTILRETRHQGQSTILHCVVQGEVSLYQTTERVHDRNYYWRDGAGNWYALHRRNIKNVAYNLLQQNCRSFARNYRENRKLNRLYLLKLTAAINRCLGANIAEYTALSWNQTNNAVGISTSILSEDTKFDRYFTVSAVQGRPVSKLSFDFRRQIIGKGGASISVATQFTPWIHKVDEKVKVGFSSVDYQEKLNVQQLYTSIGLRIGFLTDRRFSLFIERGVVNVIPIKFSREMQLVSGAGTIGYYPSTELVSGGVKPGWGDYFALGASLKLNSHWQIVMQVREQSLTQKWTGPRSLLRSSNFRYHELFTAKENQFLQLSLQYLW